MATSGKHLRPHQVAILSATTLSLATWLIAPLTVVLQPILFLNTILHELCHAFMALATGGEVTHIVIHPDTSAVTYFRGGNLVLTGSAGYVGAAILGTIIMAIGSHVKRVRALLAVLGMILTFAILLWVRGIDNGLLGLGWAITITVFLFLGAAKLPEKWLVPVAQFIGVQQIISAAQSLFVVLHLSAQTSAVTDAEILQKLTGIHAVLWAFGWTLFSCFASFFILRKTWNASY